VTEQDRGLNADLVEWLTEAGRRTVRLQPHRSDDDDGTWSDSPAHLFHYLEESAGRKLRSLAELASFLEELSGDSPRLYRLRERRRVIREGILLGVLALAWLQYYFWEVHTQIASLPCVQVFGVQSPDKSKQRSSNDTLSSGILQT
jgi:hypothetical protein